MSRHPPRAQQPLRWRETAQAPRAPHRTFVVGSSPGKKRRVPGARGAPDTPGSLELCPPGLSRPFRRPSRSTELQDRAGAGPFPRDMSPGLASGVFPEAAPAPLTEGNTSLGPGVEYAMRLELFTCRFGNSALGFLPCVLDCWSG